MHYLICLYTFILTIALLYIKLYNFIILYSMFLLKEILNFLLFGLDNEYFTMDMHSKLCFAFVRMHLFLLRLALKHWETFALRVHLATYRTIYSPTPNTTHTPKRKERKKEKGQ